MRAITRITGSSINTVTKLLVETGQACQAFHDDVVQDLSTKKIQCDEAWSFIYAKEKNKPQDNPEAGDIWTWVALDADSKLVISWFVGDRVAASANAFMKDIASRLRNRVQLTTDGLAAYVEAVYGAFGVNVDFAQLVKIYNEVTKEDQRKYSPAEHVGNKKTKVYGKPDFLLISTSYIERQNLTMRMHMRRFTRLTNGFSKKLQNHCYALALHYVYYNFVRIHKSLKVTPAMEAGIANDTWDVEDIIRLIAKYNEK